MKTKNKIILLIVILILTISIGVSFAYYVVEVKKEGTGANTTVNTANTLKVEYNAGTSTLTGSNMYPGTKVSKDFTVKITPNNHTEDITYNIKLNITNNTFEVCNDTNYVSLTNECIKGAEELKYTLKENDTVIKTGNITGVTEDVILANITKPATIATYTYTLEIEFVRLEADQNHNVNKTLEGNIKVNFAKQSFTNMLLAANGGESAIKAKGNPDFSKTSCTSDCGEDTTGMWAMEDDYGTSYYFRGSVTNNYVKFGKYASNYSDSTLAGKDMYWRIIRINGDGTIRMIYDGTEYHPNGTNTSNSIAVSSQTFNTSNNNNAYVGYTYGVGTKRGTGSSSNAKTQLDTWYTSSGLSSYSSYLAESGFCGDRSTYNYDSPYAANESLGTGTNKTRYGANIRLYANKTPSLKCEKLDYGSKSDVYTKSTTKGNGQLTNPIGLISADEVSVSGGVYGSDNPNYAYYLYNGQTYWTMSPYSFDGSYARVWFVYISGYVNSIGVDFASGVRPVINLDPDKINNIELDENGVYVVS